VAGHKQGEARKKILWVDDEPRYIGAFIEAFEEDPRFDLRFARSVDEALALLREDRDFLPDLLICDSVMPEEGRRTGNVFFEMFRQRHPDVPAILFTNVTNAEYLTRVDCPEDNSWAVRKSALHPEELVSRIAAILEMSKAGLPLDDDDSPSIDLTHDQLQAPVVEEVAPLGDMMESQEHGSAVPGQYIVRLGEVVLFQGDDRDSALAAWDRAWEDAATDVAPVLLSPEYDPTPRKRVFRGRALRTRKGRRG
jgi:DNA-binding response OmpR family regulator